MVTRRIEAKWWTSTPWRLPGPTSRRLARHVVDELQEILERDGS
jgi:hypothetical protein